MPNIAAVLKSEIARVARKEVRGEVAALKKAVLGHRAEIAALKRRAQALEQELRRANRSTARVAVAPTVAEDAPEGHRFSAKGLASQRRRLGLSAPDYGLLLGVSAQSIYNWEEGKVRPRGAHLPAIAFLRTVGKKQAMARLDSLKNAG